MRKITLIALTAAAVAGLACGGEEAAERQREVAERGARVMPFDLDATTHRFLKTGYGGRQVVTADRPDDARQVALIREHLLEEAAAFSRGRFDDPAAIHGQEMPGLATLREAESRLSIEFKEVAGGAQLTYRTADGDVRRALHAWFDAQVGDHGTHAQDH